MDCHVLSYCSCRCPGVVPAYCTLPFSSALESPMPAGNAVVARVNGGTYNCNHPSEAGRWLWIG